MNTDAHRWLGVVRSLSQSVSIRAYPWFHLIAPRAHDSIQNSKSKVATAFAADASAVTVTDVNPVLTKELVQDDEVIIMLIRPSMLFIPLSALGGLAFIAVVTFALAYMARLSWVGWNDTQAFMLGVSLCALRLGWQILEWYSRVYILTDRRIITRSGVVRVVVFQTSLRNIQHTSVFFRLRERLCGLGTIGFATAGSDSFESFWVMIRQPHVVHRTIVDAMRRYGK